MNKSISARDTLLELLKEAFPEIAPQRIESQKLDKVERYPAAAVYLDGRNSEYAGMRGHRDREQSIRVAIFRQENIDLERVFANDADRFEGVVEVARREGRFEDGVTVALTSDRMVFPPDSRAKYGSLVMDVSLKYSEAIGVK